MNIDTRTINQRAEWMRVLERCAPYDFYHLPQYHALAETFGEGTPRLFVYTEGAYTIALPLLLRDLDGFLDLPLGNLQDATSVYGYVGPVCSHSEIPDAVAKNFQTALAEQLRGLNVVTVFSRLHPLLTQRSLIANLGECRTSKTVSIDLTLDPGLQRGQFRSAFKLALNKLRRRGLTVVHDVVGTHLSDFVAIYHETMHRVEAADRYFFSTAYFRQLWETLGSRVHLFVCLEEGRPICGSLFVACHGILQYHLGGTAGEALKLAPMKLVVDEARIWGTSQGLHSLHLGGGTTADPADSLLEFKRGFSDRRHEFAAWRWVLLPAIYDQLCAAQTAANQRNMLRVVNPDYFPAYRAPTVPMVASVAPETPAPNSEAVTVGGMP